MAFYQSLTPFLCKTTTRLTHKAGEELNTHTNLHSSAYAAAATTPNMNFSTFWQQVLFTQVHAHTQNYSIRTLFSTQMNFDIKYSIRPNQWGLNISQNIFLNWLHQCQSIRTTSLNNLSPKAGTDFSTVLLFF